MTAFDLPLWLQWVVAVLLVGGGFLTLVGALGLLRLRNFYQRIHAPTLGSTLGTGLVLIASIVFFSVDQSRPVLREVFITCFIVMTMPITALVLMRAAIYRDRAHGPGASDTPKGKTGDIDDSDLPSF